MTWLAVEFFLPCWIQLLSPDFSFNEGAWLLGARSFFMNKWTVGSWGGGGRQSIPLQGEEQGAGWICNKLVKIELLPDALAPRMKERNLVLLIQLGFHRKMCTVLGPIHSRFIQICGFYQTIKEVVFLVCPINQTWPELSPTQRGQFWGQAFCVVWRDLCPEGPRASLNTCSTVV